jgi:hypothetical protein
MSSGLLILIKHMLEGVSRVLEWFTCSRGLGSRVFCPKDRCPFIDSPGSPNYGTVPL